MKVAAIERSGYRRLNFSTLNFSDSKKTVEDSMEDITPIKWSKEVLSGEKKVIIKKQ